MNNEVSLEQWHSEEESWWNLHGDYMTFQWKLTPALNWLLKSDLENDYIQFLLRPGERLLDVGCGSGWLSMLFAERGMAVLGVDVSQEQINAANELKQIRSQSNVDFQCCDLVNWDVAQFEGQFSSIFVSAFLHHLPDSELQLVMQKIESVLKPGGRVFLYEPMTAPMSGRRRLIDVIDYLNNGASHLLMNLLPRWFKLFGKRHLEAIDNGYQMCSPHERPLDLRSLQTICEKSFDIQEIRARHLFSLGFAMQSMGLKDIPRKIYAGIVALLYLEDWLLLRMFDWRSFSRPNRFILCSVKLVRK